MEARTKLNISGGIGICINVGIGAEAPKDQTAFIEEHAAEMHRAAFVHQICQFENGD